MRTFTLRLMITEHIAVDFVKYEERGNKKYKHVNRLIIEKKGKKLGHFN